ncbi:putative WRKY transcription factor 34 [Nymphaea thermarum]|nr:putative WRKY transcription factor 34 [Nymphaea thermarum]
MKKADTVEQTMNHKHAVPDDGHAWKKYGQKFIKRIAMNRSYFRCQKANCKAKKRADWSTCQSSVEVLYDGEHSHPPPNSSAAAADSISGSSSASRMNQYNLLNQVFGNGSPSDPQP